MKSGYTKAYRKELESDIWKMPPLYQRVFFYLRQKACWTQESFPAKKQFKIAINPGQIITSLSIIADGVSWYEYGIKRTPNKKTIKKILEWLESNAMVTVVSNGYGTFINIINWDTYNTLNDEKVTQNNQVKVTRRKRDVDTLKEDITLKEVNNILVGKAVEYLNQIAKTKFRATSQKTKFLISARDKEGFTMDDFKIVIDKKVADWQQDEKMCKFIRPETLFGNKFEGYLNEKNIKVSRANQKRIIKTKDDLTGD